MGLSLTLGQRTMSSCGIAFDGEMRIPAIAEEKFPQIPPTFGRVDQDPPVLWATTAATARSAIEKDPSDSATRFLSDSIGVPVDRPAMQQKKALWAASVAGTGAAAWADKFKFRARQAVARLLEPVKNDADRRARNDCLKRVMAAVLRP